MGLLERPQVDRHSLLEWSLYRNVDALTPETLVEGVRSVLPGHVVRISNGEISSKQYYLRSPMSARSTTGIIRPRASRT